jgi:hypothetical protein
MPSISSGHTEKLSLYSNSKMCVCVRGIFAYAQYFQTYLFCFEGRDVDTESISKHRESIPEIQEPSELMDDLSIEGENMK